ncbi:AIPR protein [Rhodoblastus acidophilus]|uniref:AIPR protein n=1 Tax=Rhodoblastus acidophilus TaxID=1074 RepID=A0A212R9E4_RHOAC|nr:AIPR family protein [Rhodoblastus acidophilus]PPQ39287.1 hypothetical protein CKO16_05900 [Rhodoblastus acidophilus]RAI17366.1 hypothetical protein CH337_16800 [Rhodoblastus acidophilus]SNB68839.1 AIPR protein [Rhodoblastus acidophilus]
MNHAHSWVHAFQDRLDLAPFGSAGLALFALALKFGYDDVASIGIDAVVDGPDDRSVDLVYVDRDQRLAVVAQSYVANTPKGQAKASKAATLRQALSYLIEVDLESLPERLWPAASDLRSALAEGAIDQLYVWFVHNCPSSRNVSNEIRTVGATVTSMIRAHFENSNIDIFADDISSEVLEQLYTDTNTPILVNDKISFITHTTLSFEEKEWQCVIAPIKLSDLKSLYTSHETRLFSANVRDFLGMKAGDSNINHQMQKTISENPQNFFIYNNGITLLTHGVDVFDVPNGKRIDAHGLSIVNGAQTTGTVGTSEIEPPADAFVLARFISTKSGDLIGDVVRYNNRQNAVTASDFRSTDSIQKQLVDQMKRIPNAEYDGGRRGGVSAAIKRRPNLLPSYSVGQALAAVHGDPTVAYNEKSAIWSKDALYSRYFNEQLTARHVVFCYGLLKAVENEKNELRKREHNHEKLTKADIAKLEFYRKRGAVLLLCAAIGECLETIADRVIANRFSLTFGEKDSPEDAAAYWQPTVKAISGLHAHLEKAFSDGLKNQEKVRETLKNFSQIVATLRAPFAEFFKSVENKLS